MEQLVVVDGRFRGVCECGKPVKAKGKCATCYARLRYHVRQQEGYEPKVKRGLPAAPLKVYLRDRALKGQLASVARRCGMKPAELSRILHQYAYVHWATADRIAIALGMHPIEIWPDWCQGAA